MWTSTIGKGSMRWCDAPDQPTDPPEEPVERCCATCSRWWPAGEDRDDRGACELAFVEHYHDCLRDLPRYKACERAVWWALENLFDGDGSCDSWREG